MRESAKLIVTIPIGPYCDPNYVLDTVRSVLHYTTASRKIIIVDDSGTNVGHDVGNLIPEVIVLSTPERYGSKVGILLTLSLAYLHAYKHYDFQILLRLDTDALVIGERPEEDAIRFFERHPGTGVLGSYKVDCNGEIRDFSGAARILSGEVSWVGFLSDHERYAAVRTLVSKARVHGYEMGEHCLGGANFISYECIRRLVESKLLMRKELRRTRLTEDQTFGLLVRSLGMELGDFATGNLPLGLRWRGLPSSPATLAARGKKIIHSTKFWADMKEGEIRGFFQKLRGQQGSLAQSANQ